MAVTPSFDCIVVGLGPSGLLLTAYLARMGYRVAAVERHAALYGLPRAGHVDHEIVRYLQELGIVDRFLPDAFPVGSYTWFNARGDVLLRLNDANGSESGFASDYMMYQPVLEDALVHAIDTAREPPTMLRGHALADFEQDEDGVNARLRCGDAADEVVIRGQYLFAADGARSGVRQTLGIGRRDFGFNEVWLDVDVCTKRPLGDLEPFQVCDPARPIYIGPLGRRHRRWEWAILPGEDAEEFMRPDKAWALLAERGIGPDDVEIVRQQVYTFESRVADRWRDGRVFLLGDAAHTMPPFMGQGACSGMRDAVNLAWKVDLVLRGIVDDRLLDSYQVEREPHTARWIELSIRTGAISCTLDPVAADQRDAELLSGTAPPLPPLPSLEFGLIDDADGRAKPVGKLFPQREVVADGRTAWFDDIAGSGFLLVEFGDHRIALSDGATSVLAQLRVRRVRIGGQGGIVDPGGFYAGWFGEHGIVAALVRPDRLIFGVAPTAVDIDALVARLGEAIGVPARALVEEAVHG